MTSLQDAQALLALWSSRNQDGEQAALATIVSVKGSAYRHPGARMLITASGRVAGMISGGCLEPDIRERAQEVMASGTAQLVTYDTTSPSDVVFGLGLGCNGVVRVLVEPVTAGGGTDVLRFLAVCHERRQPGRIATIFESDSLPAGARVLVWPDESVTANFASPDIENSVLEALAETSGRRAAIRQIHLPCGQVLRVLLETIAPTTSLLLCGAGDDAIPVANLAKDLGWRVTVIDPRSEFAEPSRFPNVDSILRLHPSEVLKGGQVDFSPESVAMIMTHHFQRDKEFLRLCLPRCPRYTGVLGPRVRTQRIIDELSAEGVTFAEDQLSRLHGPAGLDLGAETPAEIALSIVAEIRAVIGQRDGGSLRDRVGPIHGPEFSLLERV